MNREQKRAWAIVISMSLAVPLFVIAASFAPIAIFGEKGSFPVTWCPALLIGAGFCQTYAMSIATLIQYGRGGNDHV